MGTRFIHRQETIEQQIGIWAGESYLLDGRVTYFPEFQNRVLFPGILKIAQSIGGFELSEWYLLLRLGTAIAAFWVFGALCIQIAHADIRTTSVGMGLLAFALIFTFNHGWDVPSDYFDLLFFTVFIWLSLSRNFLVLMLVVLIASANRESSVFAGVLWFILYAFTSSRRISLVESAKAFSLSIIAYATVLGLRYLFAGEQGLARGQSFTFLGNLLSNISEFLRHPNPWSWPVLMFVMFIFIFLWIWANKMHLDNRTIRLLVGGLVIAAGSSVFGIVSELRIFIPSIVIFCFVAVILEARRSNISITAVQKTLQNS